MKRFNMSWLLAIFLLSCTFVSLSEANHEEKPPSAVVVGTVYCDTCFQAEMSKNSHFISGASVAVECQDGNSKPIFRKEVKTNRHGKFRVHLPFSVSNHVKKIEGCSVKLIRSSEPYCAVASTATSSSLHLKARKQGTHIFSAGFFTFKPQKQPDVCNQKPSVQDSKEFSSRKSLIPPGLDTSFPPPLQDPSTPELPPMPNLPNLPNLPPLPQLPPLPLTPLIPGIPGIPTIPPVPGKQQNLKTTESSKTTDLANQKEVLHPQNFLPPGLPSLPPIPLLPTPILPPNPLLPPPALPIPPVPGVLPPVPGLVPPVPGVLPPVPGLVPPVPGVLPPVPGLVPPVPGLLPPVPGVLPSPPPAVPTLPIPLPPGFPGGPPASLSPKKSTP